MNWRFPYDVATTVSHPVVHTKFDLDIAGRGHAGRFRLGTCCQPN